MQRATVYVRSLDPGLPRAVWLLQLGGLLNAFGNGVVLPFTLIYLHNVRGISLPVAGLVVAASAGAGLFVGPVAGALADRFGPRRTLAVSLLVLSVGFGLYPLVRSAWLAFLCAGLAGIGNGGFWPSQASLLGRLAPAERRHAAFAQQRVTNNLGIGLGGLFGGLVATTAHPSSFTVLFLVDAATFVAYTAVLTRVPSPPSAPVSDGDRSGYGPVVRDRLLLAVVAVNTLFVAVGYACFELMPAFGKNHNGVSETQIGFVFLVNTLTIVVLQLPIARGQEGRRRMWAFAVMGLIWACAWLTVLVAGATLEATAAAVVFAVAGGIFGIGECLHGTVQAALVADLAPPHLLGRYMAVSTTSWQVGFVAGPALGAFVLARTPLGLWALAAGLCVSASAASLLLERALPARIRRTPVRRPAEGATAAVSG